MGIRRSWLVRISYAAILAAVSGAALPLHGAAFLSIKPADIPSFSPLAFPNAEIDVSAISGDGRTIAGQIMGTGVIYDCVSFSCGIAPYTWSLDDSSARSLFDASIPFNYESNTLNAHAILTSALSQDGKTSLSIGEFRHYESAVVHNGQATLLRPKIDPLESLWASAMSTDAKIVVGNLGAQPVRWDESFGLQPITGLPNGYYFSADAISGDGHAIVLNAQPAIVAGAAAFDPNVPRGNAYRLTAAAGLTELPQLAGDDYSHAVAASFDGTIVVGNSVSVISEGTETCAVRWQYGALSPLGALPGFDFSFARDVSSDGKLVVGAAYSTVSIMKPMSSPTGRAVIWDASGQAFDLKDFLEKHYALGSQLADWQLTNAVVISDDGNVIAGNGVDPQGKGAVWIAELSVPEPRSAVLSIAAILMLSACGSCARRR